MKKIKLLVDWRTKKKGDIINMADDGAAMFVKDGYAEYVNTSDLQSKELSQEKTALPGDSSEIAKPILDMYAVMVLNEDSIYLDSEGNSKPNLDNAYNYDPSNYSDKIRLVIYRHDSVRIEFEGTPEENRKWITQTEASAKAMGLQCCVTEHKGAKSQYLNIFNIKNIPLNEDNRIAKIYLTDTLLPSEQAKAKLDKSNFSYHFTPVIGHPHWKKKYNGAVHEQIRGINPLEQNNEYPKDLLKAILKSKKTYKKEYTELKRDNSWLESFFTDFCLNNVIPAGSRNNILEKNMAAFIIHHPDRELIEEKYVKMQNQPVTCFRGWYSQILNGKFTKVCPGEIVNYIKENNLNFTIPDAVKQEEKKPENTIKDDEILNSLKDEKLIEKVYLELSKYHIMDSKEKLTTFFFALTGYLKPDEMHKTVNLLGDSSVGKDNLIKTVLRMFPAEDTLFLTRGTTATLEDDITDKKIIAFSELNTKDDEGANAGITETIKQLCEGGTSAMKKDMLTRETKFIKQQQKAVLWGSTETTKNAELETRGTCATVLSDPIKTKAVNSKSCEDIADPFSLLNRIRLKETWLAQCIRYLAKKDRYVFCPFMPAIKEYFDNNDPRSQRDVKRFIALVLSIAYLHQEQRDIVKIDDSEFIIAQPIDIIRGFEIAESFLNQSYKGYDSRLQSILDKLKDAEKSRATLQKETSIHSVNTIKERLDLLQDKGLIEYVYENGQLKRDNNSPVIRSLSIAYQKPIISLSTAELKKKFTIEVLRSLVKEDNINNDKLTGYIQACDRHEELNFKDLDAISNKKPSLSDKPVKSQGNKENEKKESIEANKQEKKSNADTFSKNDRLQNDRLKKKQPNNNPVYGCIEILKREGRPLSYKEMFDLCNAKESDFNDILNYNLRNGDIVEMPAGKYQLKEWL